MDRKRQKDMNAYLTKFVDSVEVADKKFGEKEREMEAFRPDPETVFEFGGLEDKAVEWVDGLPPVGVEFEICHHGRWHKATVLLYDMDCAWVRQDQGHQTYLKGSMNCRPIKSDKVRAIEEIMNTIAKSSDPQECVENAIDKIAKAIYEASIASKNPNVY